VSAIHAAVRRKSILALENLSERDVGTAADILRSLRDPVLLQEGLHVILVGTAEAIAFTAMAHQQMRSVFSITTLGPLPRSDVQELLAERYRFLAMDPAVKVRPPVSKSTVAELYALFRGDLRNPAAYLYHAGHNGVISYRRRRVRAAWAERAQAGEDAARDPTTESIELYAALSDVHVPV
jgi:hypothetical protein